MDTLENVIKTVVIGGIIYVIYFIERKFKIVRKSLEGFLDKKPQDVSSPKESKILSFQSDYNKIAADFESLYEELYSTITNSYYKYGKREINEIIDEWELKIKINSKGPVQKVWNNLAKQYFKKDWFANVVKAEPETQNAFLLDWYDILIKEGVKRDERKKIKVEDYSIHHYYIISSVYKIGDELVVERPCWLLNEKCIEKGIADIEKVNKG